MIKTVIASACLTLLIVAGGLAQPAGPPETDNRFLFLQMSDPQFGMFALFVLTTVAVGSFAIIRLPLPLIAKMLIIQTIAVCFVGWAVRNRKYPDPRVQQKLSQRQVLISLMPGVLGGVAFLVFSLLLYRKIVVP